MEMPTGIVFISISLDKIYWETRLIKLQYKGYTSERLC